MTTNITTGLMAQRDSAQRADQSGPELRYVSLSDAKNAVSANIILNFNEPVVAGEGVVRIRNEFGAVIEIAMGNPAITFDGNKVVINPPADLAYSTKYSVFLEAGFVRDVDGNPSSQTYDSYFDTFSFTTQNSPYPLTLAGTEGADELRGGDAGDHLSGLGGNDKIDGFGGNDVLDGGAGNDHIYSADGNDILRGGDGDDELLSGWGGWGKLGPDRLEGGAGNDRLLGGRPGDTLDGGSGDDQFYAGSWSKESATAPITLTGGEGNDRIVLQGEGSFRVDASGGAGIDTYQLVKNTTALLTISDFAAGTNGDILDVNDLFDTDALRANPFGSSGLLRLVQLGNDTVLQYDPDGPAGASPFATLALLTGVTAANLGTANFAGGLNPSGATGGLTLTGTLGHDTLKGGVLDDTLRGAAGNDILDGGGGNDLLEGGEGADRLIGSDGDDRLLGEAGNDILLGDAGNDELDGGAGEDQLFDDWGNNTMRGGDGNDYIVSGGAGTNVLDGGTGHDRLVSRGGNDTLLGGAGNDTLQFSPRYESPISSLRTIAMDGGADADTFDFNFYGSAGVYVRATGGSGSDLFNLVDNYVPGQLVITDFATGAGGDQLNVTAYLKSGGGNPFDPVNGNLRLVQRDAGTVLQVKVPVESDPSGFRDLAVLENVKPGSLSADNFVLSISPTGADTSVRLTGGAGNDLLQGTYMNDVLIGGAGADELYGYLGDDRLEGGDGNDILHGGAGTNQLIGGAGLDTVRYDGIMTFGYVSIGPQGWWVGNQAVLGTMRLLTDQMEGIERVRFDDLSWALDITGTAGKVYRLYQAAFDRTPDKVGVGFWMAKVDQGLPMSEVLDFFVHSPEFASLYGTKPTNTEIVTRFYQNVLHREPDPVGKAFWIGVLDQGKASVAEVLSNFSESPENQDAVAKIIGTGFAYQEFV